MNEFDLLACAGMLPLIAFPTTYFVQRARLMSKGYSVQDLASLVQGESPSHRSIKETLLAGSSVTCLAHNGYLLKSSYNVGEDSITIIQKNVPSRFPHLLNGAAAQIYIRDVLKEASVPLVVDVSSKLGILSEYIDCSTPLGNLDGIAKMTAARHVIDELVQISSKERVVAVNQNLDFVSFSFGLGSYYVQKPKVRAAADDVLGNQPDGCGISCPKPGQIPNNALCSIHRSAGHRF